MAPPLMHSVSPKLPPTPVAGAAADAGSRSGNPEVTQSASSDDRFSTSSLDASGTAAAKGVDGEGRGWSGEPGRDSVVQREKELDLDSMLNDLDNELGKQLLLLYSNNKSFETPCTQPLNH